MMPLSSQEQAVPPFTRYMITPSRAPHRYKLPHPFLPQVRKFGLAKILLGEVFQYNFRLLRKDYRKKLFSRPCIYGVFSGPVGGFSPRQELCTGCMRCVQEYPDVCVVDRNPEFSNFGDSYWQAQDPSKMSESPFATIWYEAETGKIMVRGMGYRGLFSGPGWDAMWTDMSEIVRPTRDGVYGREYISTEVNLGGRVPFVDLTKEQDVRQVTTPLPVLMDIMPDTLVNDSVLKSMFNAVQELGTLMVVSVEQARKLNGDRSRLVIVLDEMTELPLEGYGMVQIRDITLLEEVKSMSNCPVFLRARLDDEVTTLVDKAVEAGVDGLHLEADYHGWGYSENPTFIKELVEKVHRHMVQRGTRDRVSLVFSGGITLAEHVPKAIISGADAVAINTTLLIALQVRFEGEWRFPDSSSSMHEEFSSEWGKRRLVNLMAAWHNQIIEVMSAMGIKDVRRLRGDTGRAIYREDLEEVAFGDITEAD